VASDTLATALGWIGGLADIAGCRCRAVNACTFFTGQTIVIDGVATLDGF